MTLYFTLITSLPRHGSHFKIKETSISRMQLEKRLKMLSDQEQNTLKEIENIIWNSWFSPEMSFSEIDKRAKVLINKKHIFITDILLWYFDIRSIFVALRLRQMKNTPPKNSSEYWNTRWNMRLLHHWNESDFGLKHIYPWLSEVAKKISDNEIDLVEDILLNQLWLHLMHIEKRHFWDFEAIIIYLLRWNIVNYWSQFNEEIATERINTFIQMALDNDGIDKRISL